MIGFAVFFVLHFAFMKCFAALNKRETYTMAHIIYLLFPGARYNPSGSIQPKVFAGQPPVRNGIVIGAIR